MKKISIFALSAFLIFLNQLTLAADVQLGDLQITDPWIRASVPGQSNGAGYLQITNKSSQPDRLILATSPSAKKVELHTVVSENGVAKMREIKGIDVPAQGMVKLSPSNFHIMFIQLNAPFMHGVSIPVTLKFEKAGDVTVDFVVQPTTYNPSGSSNTPGNHGAKMSH